MNIHYHTLNLKPGASMEAVKASYRRLAKRYHPDLAGTDGNSAIKFHKIHEAYRSIKDELDKKQVGIKPMVWPEFDGKNKRGRTNKKPGSKPVPNGDTGKWRFEGVTEREADMVYVLRLSAAAAVSGISLVLPWKAEDACPACLGRGQTFTPIFGGPNRYKSSCPKCQGRGVVHHNSTVHVDLTPDMIRQGVFKMKGLGRYLPARAVRGDLVIELLVDYDVRNTHTGMFSA